MKKILFSLATTALLIVGSFVIPQSSEAVPSFARQTGLACNSCHFQHFPNLNQFGRAFRAGGFTMVGGQSLVEGDLLSMPSVLNASLITKIRYVKTNGANDDSGSNKGDLQFPDEAAFFLAGRVGEHIGFALEAQMADPTGPMFDTFKMPIGVYEINGTHIQVVPFTTAAMGAAFPTEYLNTGAMRAVRVLENRTAISAQQKIGTATEAQGFALAAYHPQGMATYTAWQPEGATASDASPFLHYIRVVGSHQVGSFDLAGGVQWWGGTTKGTTNGRQKAAAWALDAQAQGEVSGLPLGVYATYATADKSVAGETANIFNTSGTNVDDETAWSLVAELGVLPGRATVAAAYLDYDSGAGTATAEDSAITLGATYLLAQNVELQINHTWYDQDQGTAGANGDQKTYLMIFSGF
ncbi:MAG: hypothetical protein GY721_04040 [Deltaproteobacteria bacterium]|nr:hypothetical protein [Deltaproteobacteria bacterium]